MQVHGMQIKANQQSSVRGGPKAQYLDANRRKINTGGNLAERCWAEGSRRCRWSGSGTGRTGAYAVDSRDPRPGWRDGGVRTAEAALVAQQAVEDGMERGGCSIGRTRKKNGATGRKNGQGGARKVRKGGDRWWILGFGVPQRPRISSSRQRWFWASQNIRPLLELIFFIFYPKVIIRSGAPSTLINLKFCTTSTKGNFILKM